MKQTYISPLIILIAICMIFNSCSPVNFLTRAKRVPLQYSENYNYPNTKSIRTGKNKRAWIVYSDRSGNMTKEIPGGMLGHTELGFMEPLIVIGKKRDYYQLIKYNPAVLKNNRLTNKKKAEYCGWLHKDRLLLFDNSVTEVRNGIKMKNLTSIKDSHIIFEAGKHFRNDSLILYAEPALEEPANRLMGLNNVVYVFKTEDRDSKVLVSHQPEITPETVNSVGMGWIDTDLTVTMGQRLILSHAPLIKNESFRAGYQQEDSLRPAISPLKTFHPVLFADRMDSSLIFRTLDADGVIDRSGNRIFNVNGTPIAYVESKIIAGNLLNMNVIFAFDLTENVMAQMPVLTNSIQNIKQIFESSPSELNYKFAAALGDHIIPFEDNYLTFSDKIVETSKTLLKTERDTPNLALSNAIKLAAQMPYATNLIVYIGEKSNAAESPSRAIIENFTGYNCRLLSFQVYADHSDTYNNFVLQSAAIIEAYADTTKKVKRNVIVYPDQLRRINRFKENTKNVYALDFPGQSMTQGMVIFPEKGQTAEPESLINGIDAIVRQIEYDNLHLIAGMEQAFHRVGHHRNRYDDRFTAYFEVDSGTIITPEIVKAFDKVSPRWVSITHRVSHPLDSLYTNEFGLLLTEQELAGLTEFIDQLSSEQLDIKGEAVGKGKKARKVKKVRKELRDVPADSWLDLVYTTDSLQVGETEYVNSRSVRKHIKKTYLRELKKCVVRGKAKNLTLAQAQEYITTAPTISPELTELKIKELGKKKMFPDEKLDSLIHYFEAYKKLLEEQKKPAGELNGVEGIKYYMVPGKALP